MTIPVWSLFIGAILPYVWHFASIPYKSKQFGALDLDSPRVQAGNLEDIGARVWGAQLNAWEALSLFAAANLAALMAGVSPDGNWSTAAMIWVAARSLHGIFYITGIAMLRVLCFVGGLAMSIWILVMAVSV